MTTKETYDVVIIGAGAAGLQAALVLGRQRRSVLVLDSGQYRNAASDAAHMLLGQEGTDPNQLRSRTLDSLKELPSVDYVADEATTAQATQDQASIHTAAGRHINARRLIIAAGQRDVLEHVAGLKEAFGRYAFHCPYCHGYEVADQNILSIAIPGVPATKAAYQALFLKDRTSPAVRLIAPVAELPEELIRMLASAQIEVIDGVVASLSGAPGEVTVKINPETVAPGAETVLHCEVAFAIPPTEPGATELITSLDLDTRGPWITTDGHGRTSCHPVFAAGDIAVLADEQEPMTFVSQAAAKGQRAAVWVDKELFMETMGVTTAPQAPPSGQGS